MATRLRLPLLALCCLCLLTTGCRTSPSARIPWDALALTPRPTAEVQTGQWTIFDGQHARHPVAWGELIAASEWAEVVILGEIHDDAAGHAFQAAFLDAHFAIQPDTALALEMLERDEQPLLDAWRAGTLSLDEFTSQTGSTNWAGEGSWAAWYQPLLDSAVAAGAPIIAANAPRRIVRVASRQGRDALMALPEEDHPLFDPPLATNDADYRARFLERMGDMDEAHAAMAEGFYLAQRVWDATMARSVVEAVEAHGRAILCVGSFHSDHDGGVVLEILARRPGTRLLVVSVVPGASDRLAREDHGRADVVVYSGSSEP